MRLSNREKKALLGFDGGGYAEVPSSVPRVGQKTIDKLITMGLLKEGVTMYDEFGYQTTDKGQDCIYGK